MNQLNDILDQDLDPTETREWMESLKGVIDVDGTDRAHFLIERLVDETRRAGGYLPFAPTTEYVNTIPPHLEARTPGDPTMEWRIRSLVRWNAMAMVVRANRRPGDLGGHIAFSKPLALDRSGIDAAVVDKERNFAIEEAKATGKPEQIATKIAEGKLNAFFKEKTLLDQDFFNAQKYKGCVAQMLKDKGLTLVNYARVEVGQ